MQPNGGWVQSSSQPPEEAEDTVTTKKPARRHRQRPRSTRVRAELPHGKLPARTRKDEPSGRINFSVPIPRASGFTALSSGALLIEIARGDIPTSYVWPCVALAALGATYDLARRALDRHHT